ncbi:MAG TPA: sigma-54 dependent transcriptional regulator [Ktedonobacterales bacterium]|jgi:two-component system response regulator AtoC
MAEELITTRHTAEQPARILVGDDDAGLREMLRQLIEEDERYTVIECGSGPETLECLTADEDKRPDLALLDIRMPELDGIQILQRMLEQGIDVPVILMTNYGSATVAIRAMQMGAADYLTRPFQDLDEVLITIEKVLRYEQLKRGLEHRSTGKAEPIDRIVGSDPAMVQIFKTIGRVARTPATVLVTGDTGTGKELMAEAIHNASDRRSGPLIKVNCAALPESLLESELFGHEKGSFTGALTQHKGRFEAAHKGTIFLDEVGEMTPGTQKKLLRVLQEREFERVGSTSPIQVDVRVVAATNKNLRDEVLARRFREDLFFRLNVIAIHMPPLRERRGDIPALVNHFLDKHRYSPSSPQARISEDAMEKLTIHDWPGNVRELENIIQRAVVLSRGGFITIDHVVFQNELNRYVLDVQQKVRDNTPLEEMVRDVRREAILTALRLSDHDHERAARQLGLSVEDFERECQELGISVDGAA